MEQVVNDVHWETAQLLAYYANCGQDYCIGTAWKMSVDTDATPNLLRIQQKLHVVQYWYSRERLPYQHCTMHNF